LYIPLIITTIPVYVSITTIAVLGVSGILLTAGYMLWMYQRVFFEEPNPENADFPDINARELTAAVPLCVLLLFFGIFPHFYFNLIQKSIVQLQGMVM
ncbi:MAG: NADH-quinone oxidoreductase subunit M, partial [bacterium]